MLRGGMTVGGEKGCQRPTPGDRRAAITSVQVVPAPVLQITFIIHPTAPSAWTSMRRDWIRAQYP